MNPRRLSRACAVLVACALVAGCRETPTELPGAFGQGSIGVYASVVHQESVLRDLAVNGPQRIVITRVLPDGPAHRAGIRPYDVLLAIDGEHIHAAAAAMDRIRNTPPGSPVVLTISRQGEKQTITVETEKLKEDDA